VKHFLILTAMVAALIVPMQLQAATHTVTTIPEVGSPLGTTYHSDWSSLTLAKADTGTTYIDLNDPAFKGAIRVNSSGVPLLTLEISSTFAASIDSSRLEIASGNSIGGSFITEYSFTGSIGGANATLMTAAVPHKRITFSPSMVGVLRIRCQNNDAGTSGLIDTFITALRQSP
jgi:hypothetical protein